MAVKFCQPAASALVFASGNHAVRKTQLNCLARLSLHSERNHQALVTKHVTSICAGLQGVSKLERVAVLRIEHRRNCAAQCSADVVKVVGSGNGMPSQVAVRDDEDSPILSTSGESTGPRHWFEGAVEQLIFNCRFWALFAVAGSLAGSFLCFLKGMLYVADAFVEYFSKCLPVSAHTGKVILLLVEAVDVFLVGTVLMIFGFGLYELFVGTVTERALQNSSLFGMFRLRVQPRWMLINSLDELKTKIGHVVIMILLVGMFEKSKKVVIANTWDLLAFSCSILIASLALLVMHVIHKI